MVEKYELGPLKIEFGMYYRCDTINKKITIKNIDQYSFIDLFVCFHEFGHYIDSRKGLMRKFYKIAYAFAVNRLIVIPFILIYIITAVITKKMLVPLELFELILFFFYIVSFFRIISIFLMEGRANVIAKDFIIKENIVNRYSTQERILDRLCRLSIYDQLLLTILWIWNVSCFLFILFRVIRV